MVESEVGVGSTFRRGPFSGPNPDTDHRPRRCRLRDLDRDTSGCTRAPCNSPAAAGDERAEPGFTDDPGAPERRNASN